MCFSVEVSSSSDDGSRRIIHTYTHTHIYIICVYVYMHAYKRAASGSWFIITIIIRGHSPLGRPKVFSVYYYNILLLLPLPPWSALHARVCVCVCIPFQVYTASRVNTRRSLVIYGTLTHCRQTRCAHCTRCIYGRPVACGKWFSISRGPDETAELTR